MTSTRSLSSSKNQTNFLGFLLVALTLLVYAPCLRGGFLWDDDAHITQNIALRSAHGLVDIWFHPGSVQQYYPVTYTAFWAGYHLWGLNPLGYHLLNILLHAFNAILFALVLKRLRLPGVWFAAFLFALHPVHVESVAWMTELKNVLSGFLYLLSAWCYLRFEKKFYGASLLFYVLAILSKSVTCTLPAALLLGTFRIRGRLTRRDFFLLLPFLVCGLAASISTVWMEYAIIGAHGGLWAFSWPQRILIASRAAWFYLGRLLWPHPLMFIYPRWDLSAFGWGNLLFPLAIVGMLAGLARESRKYGWVPFGLFLYFILTLAPALGFVNVYPMRFSFVADHFQYLASLGILAGVAGLLCEVRKRLAIPEPSIISIAVVGLVLLNLGIATSVEACKYRSSTALWMDTLMKNPDAAIVHHNYAMAIIPEGDISGAVAHLERAEALDPSFSQTPLALAFLYRQENRIPEALDQYQRAFQLGVNDPQVRLDFATLKKKLGS